MEENTQEFSVLSLSAVSVSTARSPEIYNILEKMVADPMKTVVEAASPDADGSQPLTEREDDQP